MNMLFKLYAWRAVIDKRWRKGGRTILNYTFQDRTAVFGDAMNTVMASPFMNTGTPIIQAAAACFPCWLFA